MRAFPNTFLRDRHILRGQLGGVKNSSAVTHIRVTFLEGIIASSMLGIPGVLENTSF